MAVRLDAIRKWKYFHNRQVLRGFLAPEGCRLKTAFVLKKEGNIKFFRLLRLMTNGYLGKIGNTWWIKTGLIKTKINPTAVYLFVYPPPLGKEKTPRAVNQSSADILLRVHSHEDIFASAYMFLSAIEVWQEIVIYSFTNLKPHGT